MLKQQAPPNGAYSKNPRELHDLYDQNTDRYRDGKKVFGRAKSKIHRKLKQTSDLFQETEYVKCGLLDEIASQLWAE